MVAPLFILATVATAAAPLPFERPLELPPPLSALGRTGRWDRSTPAGFRIVALSFWADGCTEQALAHPERREAARACVERVLQLAEATRPPGLSVEAASHGLWLAHWNLILGDVDRLGGPCDEERHRQVARALAQAMERDPTKHLPSYPRLSQRWPADQVAALASLRRYDQAHREALADMALSQWRGFLDAHGISARWGLPVSEVTGTAVGAGLPRGCAQGWMTRYLVELDPALARRWWGRFARTFAVPLGPWVGFREWPPGVALAADADSGPIVMGVGVAASALSIAGARSVGEEARARNLERTADLVGRLPGLEGASQAALAAAIRFQARWQRPWSAR